MGLWLQTDMWHTLIAGLRVTVFCQDDETLPSLAQMFQTGSHLLFAAVVVS